jgi:5-methylcytosine-specific restriction protein B
MKASSKNEICAIFKNKIIPLLQEYFYNDWEKVQLVLGDNKIWGKTDKQKLVCVKKHYDLSAEKELFGSDIEDFEDEIIYEINPALESERFDDIPVESFIHIYQKPGKTVF